MIPVYLCEDDLYQLMHLKNMIEKLIFIDALDMRVVCAASGPEMLLEAMPDRAETAAYFLDIDLCADLNGIELAVKIRERDPRAFIIFTTTHSEMAVITFQYKVEALDFLLKDCEDYQVQVKRCLDNIVSKSKIPAVSSTGRLRFRVPDQNIFLWVDDILYIESVGSHKIEVHTADGIYMCNGTLRGSLSMLDERFIFCHKSVLVNTQRVTRLVREPCQAFFDNGSSCVCSLRRYASLKKLMEG